MSYANNAEALVDAVIRRNVPEAMSYVADDVVICNPIFTQSYGKSEQSQELFDIVTGEFDHVQLTHIYRDGPNVAIAMDITVGDVTIQGVDQFHLNEQGLIDRLTVTWRPIEAIIRLQNRVAAKTGMPALRLIETSD